MGIANSGYKGISRIDQREKHTHGWYVRVGYNKKMYSKFFNDEKYGGEDRALEKAVRYRNRLERELGKPRTDRAVVVNSPRNRTGVVGVHRRVRKTRTKKGKIHRHHIYEVTWNPEPYVVRRTTVSIDMHGEQEAFLKACKIRKQKEREIYGKPIQLDI